ncbi:hypothetical protein PAXRUDRAFT_715252 [Paxillus rubicundulus Ve08.2h10]|uniref:Uncharacterized protein n=1 Tax=Paxillus rubicundulus Ve08.2h10 TaxID=930991 RepID=A0A0D0DL21_9AGAM|nr:hypothetical protein PAXRUDRAFT_715252 [Paxillus rubicundulus Ve08.2h10]
MWLITGPFDAEVGNVTTTKTKLLKTGRSTPLGRKGRQLVVNSKKVSRDHCEFKVGPYTPDDMVNPSFVPTLEIYNTKEKSTQTIERDVVGIYIEVHWRRIACFLPPARALSLVSNEDCTAMGISLLTSSSALATHHITPKYELTVPLTTSLLSATQLVKIEWLHELLRLGSTPDDTHPFKLSPLEQLFNPPLESKYKPVFSPALPPSAKSFKFWEPNEERLHLLKGYRFVLLGDSEGEVDPEMRELVIRGDGEYEGFSMKVGQARWTQMLAKAKRKVEEAGLKVVIVTREQVIQSTVGSDKWREMSADAQSLNLAVVNVDVILNAVIKLDASLIMDSSVTQVSSGNKSPLPDFVPNTHPDEPSLPIVTRGQSFPKEREGVVLKSPFPSPSPVIPGPPIPPPPRKTLVRPTQRLSKTSNNEDPAPPNISNETQADNLTFTLPPLPPARSTKLKRRAATTDPTPPPEEPAAGNETSQEPPLKKFKALFDASDPDKMVVEGPRSLQAACDTDMGGSIGVTQRSESLTQNESRPLRSQTAMHPRRLDVVAEEEEQSGRSQVASTAPMFDRDGQRHSGDSAHRLTSESAPQEPRESLVVPDPGGKSRSKQKKAGRGQSDLVDTDQAFLTALASKKRGKKTEDEFDREFNNLRISKPDVRREEEEQWEILGDFDTDVRNVRGNFMVVVDMDVFRESCSRTTVARRSHDSRPNYKKFKKTPTISSRAPIELVVKSENDYGVGSGYWKDSQTTKDYTTLLATQTATGDTPKRRTLLESDDEVIDTPAPKMTRRTAHQASQPQRPVAAIKQLFLDSDEEMSQITKDDPRPSLPVKGSKRRHIIVDDDSDDVAFKGFGKKRKVR